MLPSCIRASTSIYSWEIPRQEFPSGDVLRRFSPLQGVCGARSVLICPTGAELRPSGVFVFSLLRQFLSGSERSHSGQREVFAVHAAV